MNNAKNARLLGIVLDMLARANRPEWGRLALAEGFMDGGVMYNLEVKHDGPIDGYILREKDTEREIFAIGWTFTE